jgi:hypothetical protein
VRLVVSNAIPIRAACSESATIGERPAHAADALRAWFPPGFPQKRAVELAGADSLWVFMKKKTKPSRERLCRLCGEAPAIRGSHVVPELLYKHLYDADHRLLGISRQAGRRPGYLQKGLREDLLCEACEGKFGKLEDHAARVFRKAWSLPPAERPNQIVRIDGVNYEKFKLFQMSVLWRMGVSRLRFFSGIRLGEHEGRLRRRLKDGEPGRQGVYSCAIMRTIGPLIQWNGPPLEHDLHGYRAYAVTMGGFIWNFILSEHAERLAHWQELVVSDGALPLASGAESTDAGPPSSAPPQGDQAPLRRLRSPPAVAERTGSEEEASG